MKKETPEEAIEKRFPKSSNQVIDFTNELRREGAKLRAERMYSEEEVLDIIENAFQSSLLTNKKISILEWFEQFKKK